MLVAIVAIEWNDEAVRRDWMLMRLNEMRELHMDNANRDELPIPDARECGLQVAFESIESVCYSA